MYMLDFNYILYNDEKRNKRELISHCARNFGTRDRLKRQQRYWREWKTLIRPQGSLSRRERTPVRPPDSRRSILVAFHDASLNGLLHFRFPLGAPSFPLLVAASYVMNAARPNIVYHYTSIIETTIVGINHVSGERRLNVPQTRFPIQFDETLSLLCFI